MYGQPATQPAPNWDNFLTLIKDVAAEPHENTHGLPVGWR